MRRSGTARQASPVQPSRLEQRTHIRYALHISVSYFWNDGMNNQHEGSGVTRDVSTAGLFLFAPNPPAEHSSLELDVLLPGLPSPEGANGVRLHSRGSVTRVEMNGLSPGFAAAANFVLVHDRNAALGEHADVCVPNDHPL